MWRAGYTLPGDWDKFSLGGGVNLQSHTVDYTRSFNVAGFAIWNARLAWQATPQVALSVNLNNVFDKHYVIPAYNDTGGNNYFGDPRNVQFTLKYTPKWSTPSSRIGIGGSREGRSPATPPGMRVRTGRFE
ncbi:MULTISPECIES: TonB-dependent receptor [unclassified Janthinobacterium]|uniref:TonB-dependent receptor n=1 Tax=unclassified Janthinobacterium TaxID=2610881 RepID=UPI00161F45D2|nr:MULTISPECIES: TonB-dependent receptor [unclassified Janthinobacterium]MBB5610519.1 outer membrane receptor for ferric coprogen and ferric-rhodotorulic acid [Janthinobacterium sp. S3T4]MBB5615819.1 outer membrane receptor for ferric coprogen and ferric-rhodotorulic acid [Janthinobacterium sp. S3M3]